MITQKITTAWPRSLTPYLCTGVSTFVASSRSAATLDSSGSGAPSDEISVAPSMSSLSSFDEHSGSAPSLFLQQAQGPDTTGRPLPAVFLLPPALDHTTGQNKQAVRRRSRRGFPLTLPSAATTTGAGIEDGSACHFPPNGSDFAAAVESVVPTERVRSSLRLGIAFGGAGKRRRSRRLSSSSNSSSVGVRMAGSALAAAVDTDGQEKSVASAAGRPLVGAVEAAGSPASSTTTAVATTALLKRKINWWRGRSKSPPKLPPRSSALTTPTGEDGLLRGTITSPAPSYSRGESDCGDGRPASDGSTVSMVPSVYSAVSREPQHQLLAARGGVADDERTLAGSVTSSLTSLGGVVRGPASAGPFAETDSSVAILASLSPASGSAALVGGHSVAGSAATASLPATTAPGPGSAGAGVGIARAVAGDGGASGGARGRLDSGEHNEPRKKRRGRGGTGTVQRVHKISLGSKSHQKVRR